ncbi:MAG: DUF4097 family beta strand repeat-containing protein, partial [Candidatus Acidiferrum sp.]
MKPGRNLLFAAAILAATIALEACAVGPSINGNFDEKLSVTGPVRLELTNASGDVQISGGADGQVHVRGEVRYSGSSSANRQKYLDEILKNPPLEQKGNTIRIGKDLVRFRNVAISYTIEVPHDTEVSVTVASGAQTIRNVRGPVKLQSASGAIRVEQIDGDVQISTASGSVAARELGDDVRANSSSGNVSVTNSKGSVRANSLSGDVQIIKPGGRAEAETASGSIEVQGAQNDVSANTASGHITVQGIPGANAFWDITTASG